MCKNYPMKYSAESMIVSFYLDGMYIERSVYMHTLPVQSPNILMVQLAKVITRGEG